ncbi:DUF302 domain-containing protein [soil metagenome]
MKKMIFGLFGCVMFFLGSVNAQTPVGLVVVPSANDVATTQAKLEAAIAAADGLMVMTVVDHTLNAASVGLDLRPTRVVLFGNPNAGTPLMQAAQSVAIDLPQKMLIWEDEAGNVFVAYNNPYYLKARHSVEGQDELLAKISGLLDMLAKAATAQ